MNTKCKKYDIICIGLGITGLYFGYKAKDYNKQILFIEKDNHVGGRIKSVDIKNNILYWAEGCAARYFYKPNDKPSIQNDYYVAKLLKELNISSSIVPNDKIETDKSYIEVINKINELYPNITNDMAKISFPSLVETLGYSIQDFADKSGYHVFQDPMNLNMAMRTINKFSYKEQNLVNGGYENVCKKIYDIIKYNHKFKFNKIVERIDYCNKHKRYIINNKYIAKKVIFTGTINQLNNIIINVPHLIELKRNLIQSYFDYSAIRIYIKIKEPWWNKDDLFKKWNTKTPLNQIFYYTQNTIQIYSNMSSSEVLYYMIPPEYRVLNEFIDSNKVVVLTDYISNILSKLFNVKNVKIYEIWYKFSKDASQFIKPVNTDYDLFFKNIQKNKKFYMLSGDYTYNPGWINSCLYSVEDKFKNIIK